MTEQTRIVLLERQLKICSRNFHTAQKLILKLYKQLDKAQNKGKGK